MEWSNSYRHVPWSQRFFSIVPAASRLSYLKRRKIKKNLWNQGNRHAEKI